MTGRPAVFLDRDGVLVDELEFLVEPDALRLVPGAAEAVARLNRAELPVVVVTNQSAVARGLLDEAGLARVHARLAERLAQAGARADLVLHCPHHPTEGVGPLRRACACRKPAPGMLEEAARRLGLDLGRSWLVGDAARDLEAGRRAGLAPERLLLVGTGKGAAERARLLAAGEPAPRSVADLAAAADLVLAARPAADQGR